MKTNWWIKNQLLFNIYKKLWTPVLISKVALIIILRWATMKWKWVSIQFDLPLQIQEIRLPIPIHFKKKGKKADLGLSDLIYREKKPLNMQ